MAGAVQRNARFAIVLVNGRHSAGVADRDFSVIFD